MSGYHTRRNQRLLRPQHPHPSQFLTVCLLPFSPAWPSSYFPLWAHQTPLSLAAAFCLSVFLSAWLLLTNSQILLPARESQPAVLYASDKGTEGEKHKTLFSLWWLMWLSASVTFKSNFSTRTFPSMAFLLPVHENSPRGEPVSVLQPPISQLICIYIYNRRLMSTTSSYIEYFEHSGTDLPLHSSFSPVRRAGSRSPFWR